MGIETGLNNRTRRAIALLASARAITPETFRSFKYDSCFAPDSDFAVVVKDLAERNFAGDPLLEEAGENLRRYDLCTNLHSRAAAQIGQWFSTNSQSPVSGSRRTSAM